VLQFVSSFLVESSFSQQRCIASQEHKDIKTKNVITEITFIKFIIKRIFLVHCKYIAWSIVNGQVKNSKTLNYVNR